MAEAGPRRRSHVPAGLYWSARLFAGSAPLWRRLADIESAVLRDDLLPRTSLRPIHVAGLARSGTTILTELLDRHRDVTSHRYSDFPNVYTPYWRNWLADRTGRRSAEAVERAHRDRLMVTPESPEAVEEVIWMQFFDRAHDPGSSHVLDGETDNPAFEVFYTDHIAKLLLARGANRYLAKGNYNITRLGYLLKLFPAARFIVPVREPVAHVASLVKQDRLFERLAAEDPRVVAHLHRSGHFEFGPDKRCIHVGDDRTVRAIEAHWAAGRSAEGWALCWNAVYGWVARAVEADPALRRAVHFVRYEDLCAAPDECIPALLAHAELDPAPFEPVLAEYAQKLRAPDYYEPGFSSREVREIRDLTAGVAQRFGYTGDGLTP